MYDIFTVSSPFQIINEKSHCIANSSITTASKKHLPNELHLDEDA